MVWGINITSHHYKYEVNMITQNTAIVLPQHTFKCETSLGNINILIDSAFNPWFTMDEFESFFKPIIKSIENGEDIYAKFKNITDQYATNINFAHLIDFKLFKQLYNISELPSEVVDAVHNEICRPLFTYIEELKQEFQISQTDKFTLDLETIPNKYNRTQIQRLFSNIFNSLIELSKIMDETAIFYQTEKQKHINTISQLRTKPTLRTYTVDQIIDTYRKLYGLSDNQFMECLRENKLINSDGDVTQLALDRKYCIIENDTIVFTSKFWKYIRPKLKQISKTNLARHS